MSKLSDCEIWHFSGDDCPWYEKRLNGMPCDKCPAFIEILKRVVYPKQKPVFDKNKCEWRYE